MISSLIILGSTGSIGKQAIEVCQSLNIQIKALVCGSNITDLFEQILLVKPEVVAVYSEKKAVLLQQKIKELNLNTTVLAGMNGICDLVFQVQADMVLSAIVGMKGLLPTVFAIKSNKQVALANKESLVVGGDILLNLAKKHNVSLFPVDSEHSAIFQCLSSDIKTPFKKIWLTASGGPFFGRTLKELETVSVYDALAHPTWNMGKKISVDSATLMNKGLEMIEAHYLFHATANQIEPIIHRQSIIHSMVEWEDGSTIAQLSYPSMKLPIQLAFTYPERKQLTNTACFPFMFNKDLSFHEIDTDVFWATKLAKWAITEKKGLPIVLNAANEILVEAFLSKHLSFLDIQVHVKQAMEHFSKKNINCSTIEDCIMLDQETKDFVSQILLKRS